MKKSLISAILSFIVIGTIHAQKNPGISTGLLSPVTSAVPLQEIHIEGVTGHTLVVLDGAGLEYVRQKAEKESSFMVGGALGLHSIQVEDKKGRVVQHMELPVHAETGIVDGGYYAGMLELFETGMRKFAKNGVGQTTVGDTTYRHFVFWGLDHYHTMKGMQYFEGIGHEFVDLFRLSQRENGMIMSNVGYGYNKGYYETAYGPEYTTRYDEKTFFVRQPSENHCEYIYVLILYKAWMGLGDLEYVKRNIHSASRALDYSVTDDLRWSEKYQLLKRPYTIDSWDFQIKDQYTPDLKLSAHMMIDREHTKFGIFYGDNTGYALACEKLAELYLLLNDQVNADKYITRAKEIRENLDQLSWNGRFFTHYIDEDETVIRDIGVDPTTQISHSNMYSINRNIKQEQKAAIINTYLDLKENLPEGSPGEWYAIYPPFEKGFPEKWQYMNGGIAGHAAGELALGAFDNGFEDYGSDILNRLNKLGRENGNKISFAYTGAFPTPPEPEFTRLDISQQANMDILSPGRSGAASWFLKEAGNDMQNLPTGLQNFQDIPFQVTEPGSNRGRAVIAVSSGHGLPSEVRVPVNKSAKSIYLLHDAEYVGQDNICGNVTFYYEDGTQSSRYIVMGTHMSTWWFPVFKSKSAGIAWKGPNLHSREVGVYWSAIDNPVPEKKIKEIGFHAAADQTIYAVLGVTLSNQPHYVRPPVASFGGPDNWAAGTATAALIEGLCGVKDISGQYKKASIAPRWSATESDTVSVVVKYPASSSYVAYSYRLSESDRILSIDATGTGDQLDFHVLLPVGFPRAQSVFMNGEEIPFRSILIEKSSYVDFSLSTQKPSEIQIRF